MSSNRGSRAPPVPPSIPAQPTEPTSQTHRRRAESIDESARVPIDQQDDLSMRDTLLAYAAILAQLPSPEPVIRIPFRYGDENTLENTRLTLPQFIENIRESGAGLRCPLAIIGCNCYSNNSDPPTRPTLGLPRTTARARTAHPYECYLPVAPGQVPAFVMVPPVAVMQSPLQAPPSAAAQPQNHIGVSASVPVHIQAPNLASQPLSASTSQKRKRSKDTETPEDPRAKRPALNPSVQSAPSYNGLPAPRNNRTRVSAAASPPLEAQDWESSLPEVAQLSSFDAMMQSGGSGNRRNREAASVPSSWRRGAGGALHTSTPMSVFGPTYNQVQNLSSTYPSSAYSSRPSGVVEDYLNQNHKRSQASEPSGEPKAKRPVRSRGATLPPNIIAQQTASRLENPTQPSNARISPVAGRRQLTPVTRNKALEGSFDKDRCRSCLGLDGENGHPIGAMICCSNEQIHGTDDHWFHFRCVGLDVTPAEDDQWYCWECKDEMGPASERASSSIPSTEDESDNEDKSDNNDTSDDNDESDDDNTAPRRKPLNRNYVPSAGKTIPGQVASNRNPKGANWSAEEKGYVTTLMHEVMQDPSISKTEKRWVKVGNLLQERYNVTRTATAVKNYWNREGRSTSGLDERNKKNPNKLVTGVQDPEDRKALRVAKKHKAKKAKTTAQDDIEEEEMDGEEEWDQPITKLTKPIKSTKRPRPLGEESDDEGDVEEYIPTTKRQRRHP